MIHWPGQRTLLLLLVGLFFAGCTREPLLPVSPANAPLMTDDLNYRDLEQAIDRSLAFLETAPPTGPWPLTSHLTCDPDTWQQALLLLRRLIRTQPDPDTLNKEIRANFDLFQARGVSGWFNFRHHMLMTGYYQPQFEGSLVKHPPFLFPVYGIPPDMVIRRDPKTGARTVGRFDKHGHFSAYWSREEIENGHVPKDSALAWLKDPFDVYVLQIQGSGIIRLPDGSIRAIHYASGNGHPYRSIGKILVDSGLMELDEVSMDTIRTWLREHPEQRQWLLFQNPSYVFFRWMDTHGAVGALGKELTPGRSVAADLTIFPRGSVAWLQSTIPVVDREEGIRRQPISRFVLIQDKGGAIKGPGRVDLFLGMGPAAAQAAGRMREDGFFYLLAPKQSCRQSPKTARPQ